MNESARQARASANGNRRSCGNPSRDAMADALWFGPAPTRLPIAANSATVGQVQSRVCAQGTPKAPLDGFWPPRTLTEREPNLCLAYSTQ